MEQKQNSFLSSFKEDKRGVSGGLLTALIFGIGGFIIGLVVIFIIVDTIANADLITNNPENIAVTNESELTTGSLASANNSGYIANRFNSSNDNFILTACWSEYYQSNGSATTTASFGGYNVSLVSANCSIDSSNANISSDGTYGFPNVSVSYTFDTESLSQFAVDNIAGNFSEGVQNDLAPKIKTAVLIGAIVFILSILALLVAVYRRMDLGDRTNAI